MAYTEKQVRNAIETAYLAGGAYLVPCKSDRFMPKEEIDATSVLWFIKCQIGKGNSATLLLIVPVWVHDILATLNPTIDVDDIGKGRFSDMVETERRTAVIVAISDKAYVVDYLSGVITILGLQDSDCIEKLKRYK